RQPTLLVHVMRQVDINCLDFRICQQLLVTAGELVNRRKILAEPAKRSWAAIANRYDFRSRGHFSQMTPTRRRACKFAPHYAAADDAETYRLHLVCRSSRGDKALILKGSSVRCRM